MQEKKKVLQKNTLCQLSSHVIVLYKNMTLHPRKASNTFTTARRSKLETVKLPYMMFLPQDEGVWAFM